MYVTCPKCHDDFWRDADEPWKRLCLDCWKESKRRETGPTTYSGDRYTGFDHRLTQSLAENQALRARVALLQARLQMATAHQSSQFDMDDLRALRRLCHPDRHNGSEAATRMSQKINQAIQGGAA